MKGSALSAGIAAAGTVMMVLMALFFRISVTTKADYMETLDPAYPYLQAVAVHNVNGRPFLQYLSGAVRTGSDTFDGVNVTRELLRFQEDFRLHNATDGLVTHAAGRKVGPGAREAYLAVPPGGYMVMTYVWP
jgi:hypothetical protein